MQRFDTCSSLLFLSIFLYFTLGSPYDFAYLVFFKSSQPSAHVFVAKRGFASFILSTFHFFSNLSSMLISEMYGKVIVIRRDGEDGAMFPIQQKAITMGR